MSDAPLPESFSLLVLEDDPTLGRTIVDVMGAGGIRAVHAQTIREADRLIRESSFDVVLADWVLPDGDPSSLIAESSARDDTIQFVAMTGQNRGDSAAQALKAGAEQFLLKPLDFEALQLVLTRLARKAQAARAAAASAPPEIDPFGTGVADLERPQCARIARQKGNVVIAGETGSGKGVMARWIHHESGRTGPFVSLNCAGLNPELLESELFGHERGAFTGAAQRKRGLFELARGGTLFLDELGELPRISQAKILKVVEEGKFRRVGGTQEITTDARVIGASHADLSNPEILRPDLYYRLATYRISLRPLRERRYAIQGLAEAIARELRPGIRLAPDALAALRAHEWPGNIRELRNVIERSVSLLEGNTLTRDALDLLSPRRSTPSAEAPLCTLAELESAHIDRVVRHCAGNLSQAAKVLGISRTTLYKKLAAVQASA